MQGRLEKYSSALGLTFERQGDSIAFALRHVLQADPECPFKIGLTLMNERIYKSESFQHIFAQLLSLFVTAVVHCEPPLGCLSGLENALVRDNDMKRFMTSVRKAFHRSTEKMP